MPPERLTHLEGVKMKASRFLTVLALLFVILSCLPATLFAQELRRAPEKEYISPPENFGFVPPRFELYQMKPERLLLRR